ncbi:acyltransferase [Streptomyces sp. NPDC047097]|uniref:acyltransferase family protein n=1 Tax=Streptomyces sp. NPDC047097 TaxID=3155260 RepID=UPI0034005547
MATAAVLPARLASLTGLRFLAAAAVFAFHASFEGLFSDAGVQSAVGQLFSKAGWAGVSFFFVLSGFVLAWSARPGERPARFLVRRLARIYPSHLVTALAALALIIVTGGALTAGEVVPNLLLLHSWFPRLEIFISGNPVSWSLSCELLFYLAFPLLWRGLSRIRPRRLWWWAGGVTAAVALMPLVAQLLPAGPPLTMPDGSTGLWQYWFVYVLPPVRALEFVLGVLLARLVREGLWKGPGLAPSAALTAAGYLLATQVPYLYGLVAATLVPLALLIAAAATADVTGRGGPLAGRTMVWLGETSFAFYLVHRLVLVHGHQALGGRGWSTPVAALVLLAALAGCLSAARLLHLAVERPLARLGNPPRRRAVPGAVGGPGAGRAAGPLPTHHLATGDSRCP